ncbi:hypothetical protein LBMAG42_53590 [Deltaproteobacteria bacterium]|nr:hypothetical protein LBMAG42_53590 [Deltaproteobacteria bacterium]
MAGLKEFADAVAVAKRFQLVYVKSVQTRRTGTEVGLTELRGTGKAFSSRIDPADPRSRMDWAGAVEGLAFWDRHGPPIPIPGPLAFYDTEKHRILLFQGFDGRAIRWICRDGNQDKPNLPQAVELFQVLPFLEHALTTRAEKAASLATYEGLLGMAAADGAVSESEWLWLKGQRANLGLSDADVADVHSRLGVSELAALSVPADRVAVAVPPETQGPRPEAPSPATPQPTTRERRDWDEESYFADMATRPPALQALHRRVYAAARLAAGVAPWTISWGTGKSLGSFTVKTPEASLLSAYSGGTLSLNLGAWGKLPAATSTALVQAFVATLGFAPTDAICDGGTQFPNIAAGLLQHDPDGARLPLWLRRAQSLIAGEAEAPAAPSATPQSGPLPAHCADALRIVRDADILAYTSTRVSTDRELSRIQLGSGNLWLEAAPNAGIAVWFWASPEGVQAVVGWNSATEECDRAWVTVRDRLEAAGPSIWPGWQFQRADWKAGAYEAYSKVGADETAEGLAARLIRVVAALSAALVKAGAGTAAPEPEDAVERTATLLGLSPTELGGYLGKFAVQTSREDWSNLTESLGTPPRPFTRKAKASGKWMDGRVGLDLVDPWCPGAFAGVFLDPTDHKVTPSRPHLGTDFVIILDTQHTQNRVPYDTLPAFGALVRRLESAPRRWDVLDHLATAKKPNRWHPIHLRRPMAEIWEGTSNAEERYAAWLAAARDGLALLLSGGEVRSLRAAWAQSDSPPEAAAPDDQGDADDAAVAEENPSPKKRLQERPESMLLEEAEARGVKPLLVRLRGHLNERCAQVAGLNEVRKVWAFAYACKGSALGYPTGAVTVLHLRVHDHAEPGRLLVQLREVELRRGNDARAMDAFLARWAKGVLDGGGYRDITLGTDEDVDAFWHGLAEFQPFSAG